jgi:hypothetical protein
VSASDGTADVGRVSGEIDTLRGELGTLVAELDRRRHEAFDLSLQARRHPMVVIAAASTVALLVGGMIALVVGHRRERQRPSTRVRETRRAMARLLDHPDRVAAEPSLGGKVLAAIGTTAGTVVVKRLLGRYLAAPRARPRAGAQQPVPAR